MKRTPRPRRTKQEKRQATAALALGVGAQIAYTPENVALCAFTAHARGMLRELHALASITAPLPAWAHSTRAAQQFAPQLKTFLDDLAKELGAPALDWIEIDTTVQTPGTKEPKASR